METTKQKINISEDDIQFLMELKNRLHTQDNRITDQPIFQVRVKRRIHGLCEGYSDKFEWVDVENDYDTIHPNDFDAMREHYEDCHEGLKVDDSPVDWEKAKSDSYYEQDLMQTMGYEAIYYQEIDEIKQSCLTEEGAQWYINANGHNLNKPFIYADGSYRNFEYQRLRKIIMSL